MKREVGEAATQCRDELRKFGCRLKNKILAVEGPLVIGLDVLQLAEASSSSRKQWHGFVHGDYVALPSLYLPLFKETLNWKSRLAYFSIYTTRSSSCLIIQEIPKATTGVATHTLSHTTVDLFLYIYFALRANYLENACE